MHNITEEMTKRMLEIKAKSQRIHEKVDVIAKEINNLNFSLQELKDKYILSEIINSNQNCGHKEV